MKHNGWIGVLGMVSVLVWSGCASKLAPAEMSAKDEARYKAAIEKADAENPPQLEVGETVVINYGSSEPSAEVIAQPVEVKRTFEVSRQEYDAFFEQSPAVVLGRMVLQPINDGTSLLGYRIKTLTKPFESVDLAQEDIIVGINGKLPRTPDDYFNQWQAASKSSHCVVNIQRGVDRFDLSWQVK